MTIYTKTNLPPMDDTKGMALKTIPMVAIAVPGDTKILAPWGIMEAKIGVHHHMVQSLDNGKGLIDQYANISTQLFNDYKDNGEAPLDDLRAQYLRDLYGSDSDVRYFVRTQANQEVVGRALADGQIETAEGVMNFTAGSYINKDSKGRVWAIDENTFHRDYKLL